MKKVYNTMFDKLVPEKSDDEVFRAVLNRREGKEKTMSKKLNRKVFIPIIAAAVVAATSIGVVAVNGNTGKERAAVHDGYLLSLGQSYTDADGNDLNLKDKSVNDGMFDLLNVDISQVYQGDGYTFEVTGMLTDGDLVYIYYDLIFDEDYPSPYIRNTDIELYDQTFWDTMDFENHTVLYDLPVDTRGAWGGATVTEHDGKIISSNRYILKGFGNCVEPYKIRFTGVISNYNVPIYDKDIVDDMDVTVEIPISEDYKKYNKTVTVNNAPDMLLYKYGTWKLTDIEVTPLQINFNMDTDQEVPDEKYFRSGYMPNMPIIVTFKDGSKLELNEWMRYDNCDHENKKLNVNVDFNYPIKVDEIETIQFANAVVDMNGNTTVVDIPEVGSKFRPAD